LTPIAATVRACFPTFRVSKRRLRQLESIDLAREQRDDDRLVFVSANLRRAVERSRECDWPLLVEMRKTTVRKALIVMASAPAKNDPPYVQSSSYQVGQFWRAPKDGYCFQYFWFMDSFGADDLD
jgi:hypothetical protein